MKTQQLILLGPPGVGVKEHATLLAERWQIPQVSMGNLIRTAIAQGSEIGIAARPAVEAGELVPDDLVNKLMRKRFEQPDVMLQGWVLDGFPQTLEQAQAFDEWWQAFGKPAATVVYLKAATGILINRLANQPDQHEPISAIRHRLEHYQAAVAPCLEYYQQRSQLVTVNGSLPFAEVARELAKLGHEETGAAKLIQDEAALDTLLAHESWLVVDCMASWCGSCKQVTPLIDRLAEAYRDRLPVMKMDFDINRQITKRFGLRGLPAVMFFKDGDLQETLVGVKSYPEYCAAVTRLLG